jgi:hypothetical protein
MTPPRFVLDERRHERQSAAHAASVRQLERPQIVGGRREDLRGCGHRIEIEQRVAVRLGALELQWKAAVGGHLLRQQDRLETHAAHVERFTIAGQRREGRHLHHPAGAVVVLRVPLFDAVGAVRQPAGVLGEPLANRRELRLAERPARRRISIARATSTRWIVSMIPVPRPVVTPWIACA